MTADLLIHNARLVATVDNARRELPGGWVAITNGLISGVGSSTDPVPAATERIDASGCLVTPGLINTHHHLYQNLTRAYPPMTSSPLFGWLQTLYPLWRALDEEGAHVSAWIGLAELALSGWTPLSEHRNTPYIRGDTGGGTPHTTTPTTDRGMPHNISPEGFTYGYQHFIHNGM